MARDMETVIRISGNLDASLRRVIEHAAEQIEQIDRAARQSADAVDKLSDTIGAQSDELKKAQKQYASYILNGEKSSAQAKELAKKIKSLSGELSDNRTRLRGAEEAAQRLAGELDDVGDASRNSKGGFTVMKGAMANLVSGGIQMLISACANAVSSIYGLSESTREFRQDMATLETAYDRAGFTAEQATDTWTDLYAIFGEDDRAVEAANNIARLADTQAELDEWTRITTGVWGTYQDALPVESLAEAAAETANTGTVVGTLADALNWSSEAAEMFSGYMSGEIVTAEDAFNEALAECTTVSERQALITDTLTALYGEAADTYNETAGSIIDANKANADYTRSLADMGEMIEPVTTAVKSGLNGLLIAALELMGRADLAGFAEDVSDGFAGVVDFIGPVADNILPALSSSIGSIFDALSPAVPVLATLVSNLMPLIATLLTTITPIITMVLNVLTPVIGAISQIINELIPPLIDLLNMMMPIIQMVANIITSYVGYALQFIMPIINGVTTAFSGLVSFLQNIFLGNWSGVWESVKSIFSGVFQSLEGLMKAPMNAVISLINSAIDGINSIGFTIPDWVPLIGGKDFHIDIPTIPMLATGGFTEGISIAGEAGTEAVISFDPAYRDENLSYWARAGRMLGVTTDNAGFELSGYAEGSTVIDMGGVTFSPNINITGKADKESVVKAIKDEYPEFLDMLEQWLYERGLPVYA